MPNNFLSPDMELVRVGGGSLESASVFRPVNGTSPGRIVSTEQADRIRKARRDAGVVPVKRTTTAPRRPLQGRRLKEGAQARRAANAARPNRAARRGNVVQAGGGGRGGRQQQRRAQAATQRVGRGARNAPAVNPRARRGRG